MKEVNITLTGQGMVFLSDSVLDMDRFDKEKSFWDMEEEGILDMDTLWESVVILSDVKIEYNNQLIIKKGKYINTKEYFSKIFQSPRYFIGESTEVENYFKIPLEDDEEFDPMKLQLVKTDYELDFLPYGIITDYIIYDGKKIECNEHIEYQIPNEDETHLVDYELPYV